MWATELQCPSIMEAINVPSIAAPYTHIEIMGQSGSGEKAREAKKGKGMSGRCQTGDFAGRAVRTGRGLGETGVLPADCDGGGRQWHGGGGRDLSYG